jgi:hypothetical protein
MGFWRYCANTCRMPSVGGGDHCGMYVLEVACFSAHPVHVAALQRRQGALARMGDGRWLDLAFWDTRESAQAAADEMFDTPEMSDWLAQVNEFAEAA